MADLLTRMLRRASSRQYLPFSEPRWRGTFPFVQAKRDFFLIPNFSPLVKTMLLSKLSLPARQSVLSLYQDRRTWHPEGDNRPAVSVTESRPRMIDLPPDMAPRWPPDWGRIERPMIRHLEKLKREAQIRPGHIAFENPEKMIICLERKIRREVLLAMGLAKKGARSKIHHWNQYSKVRCW